VIGDLLAATGQGRPLRLLVLGAHPDDIEIGCGGTLLRVLAEHPRSRIRWVVFSGSTERGAEARDSAQALMADTADLSVAVHDLRDGHLPYAGSKVKDLVEDEKGEEPDIILTHRRDDLHQDHRLVAEVTWQTFRHHLILEYDVPKFDGDLGPANLFVTLDEGLSRRKVDHLLAAFPSQRDRAWFTADTFWSVLRLRGLEAASPTRLAEGFVCRKVVV
jgi:LmbE family N-acetylglucosaminyl deacetylase